MNELARLQAGFQAAVLSGDASFEQEIVTTARADAKRRVAIYADAYRLRLVETLRDNYPGVHGLLGTEKFDALARRYIETTPSTFRSVRWYGDRFAEFLAQSTDVPVRELLVELAGTDWAMSLAFDAADAEPLDDAELAAVDPARWGALVFGFHPSVRRLDLHFDTPPLRSRLAAGEETEPPTRRESPLPWLLWRQELRVQYRSMDIDEAFALDSAREDTTFGEICGALAEWVDEEHAPMRAAEFLKRWLADGMVVHFRISGD